MCVIICRDPGIEIPFSKLESASYVNPDGWGIVIADRGKLEYRHDLKCDPIEIAKALEDAKDHQVLLHLRFNTKGATNLENCHPFKLDVPGLDIAFAHNGTLYRWGPTDKETFSDSYKFNRDYLSPLVARCGAFVGNDKVLEDQFLISALEDAAGSNSKFALINGDGLTLIINHEEGHEFEGWWASNTYSFQRNHRETTGTSSTYYGSGVYSSSAYAYGGMGSSQSWNDGDWQEIITQAETHDPQDNAPFEGGKKITAQTSMFSDADQDLKVPDLQKWDKTEEEEEAEFELQQQCEQIGSVIDHCMNTRLNDKLIEHLLQRKTKSFCELASIDNLLEVTKLDPEDLLELVSFYPEAASVLLKDLLFELYLKHSVKAQNALGVVGDSGIIARAG